MAFVGRLQNLDLSQSCYPSYGVPTLTPVGLSPTGRASLRWTHNGRFGRIYTAAMTDRSWPDQRPKFPSSFGRCDRAKTTPSSPAATLRYRSLSRGKADPPVAALAESGLSGRASEVEWCSCSVPRRGQLSSPTVRGTFGARGLEDRRRRPSLSPALRSGSRRPADLRPASKVTG